jgi:hypothetical protein
MVVNTSVTVFAGATVSLNLTATDPDQDFLSFKLAPGTPAGVSVNPSTGLLRWPTSPALGGTTNQISVIVTDNGQPPLSATGTVTVVVLPVANPPVLAPIANYKIYDGFLLIITNSATDNNFPSRQLTFSLRIGAPTNATIDPVTGLFQWRPVPSQAPSTNIISVVVTDNGNPPLNAAQEFTVIVNAVAYEWAVALGSTGVLVGQTSSVPLSLEGSLPLTNLTVLVQAPLDHVTNLTLQSAASEILLSVLQPIGTNQYAISMSLDPAQSPGGLRTVAHLGFLAVPQTNSSIASVPLSQLSGLQNDGQIAPKPASFGGRVFIVGRQPLLDAWLTTNAHRMLSLYGNPGRSYEVDYTTNLSASKWQYGWRVPMTNVSESFPANASLPQVFYRALEFSASPPILDLNSSAPSNLVLLLYGQSGSNYTIVSGTNLRDTSGWSPIAGFTLTNSFQFISTGAATNQIQFFRARRP